MITKLSNSHITYLVTVLLRCLEHAPFRDHDIGSVIICNHLTITVCKLVQLSASYLLRECMQLVIFSYLVNTPIFTCTTTFAVYRTPLEICKCFHDKMYKNCKTVKKFSL